MGIAMRTKADGRGIPMHWTRGRLCVTIEFGLAGTGQPIGDGMNIDHLREFTYLAETLSFAATARHFFIGASVLSKHIAAMEDDLKVKLFNRDSRKVSLTPDGEAFYQDIVAVVDSYDRALANLEARRGNADLHLRVGYLRGAARPFLPTFVQFMEREHPEVDVDLRCMEYGELIRAHRSHNVDLIFNMDFDPEATDACDFASIYQDRLYVVVGKKHHLAKNADATVGELAGEHLLLPDDQAYPGLAQAYERIVRNSCDVSTAKRYSDVDTFYLRIAQGKYIGFSSGHNFKQFEGRAAFLPLVGVDTSYTVSAQWLKSADARIAQITTQAAAVCAEYMKSWTDGVASQSEK